MLPHRGWKFGEDSRPEDERAIANATRERERERERERGRGRERARLALPILPSRASREYLHLGGGNCTKKSRIPSLGARGARKSARQTETAMGRGGEKGRSLERQSEPAERKKIPELKEQTPVAHPRKVRLHKPSPSTSSPSRSPSLSTIYSRLNSGMPVFYGAQTHARPHTHTHARAYTYIHVVARCEELPSRLPSSSAEACPDALRGPFSPSQDTFGPRPP